MLGWNFRKDWSPGTVPPQEGVSMVSLGWIQEQSIHHSITILRHRHLSCQSVLRRFEAIRVCGDSQFSGTTSGTPPFRLLVLYARVIGFKACFV